MKPIKVIDLFAGPGGLGEGFSSLKNKDGSFPFKIAVSVEKEPSAHATLTLRAFVREFEGRKPPKEYYQYVRGEITKDVLFDTYPKQYEAAQKETLYGPKELGKHNRIIHEAIEEAVGNEKRWVLIGGPPCQAYSLVGRARNQGTKGYKAEDDPRHFLYKEYLKILKEYQPPVFVMENVKGILSSKVDDVPIFTRMLSDLHKAGYKVYSFSTKPKKHNEFGPVYDPRDFVIRAEDYGIPQARHRVILLGVRENRNINEDDIILKKTKSVSLKSVIGSLPKLRSGLSKEADDSDSWIKALADLSISIVSEISNAEIKKTIKDAKASRKVPRAGRGSQFLNSFQSYETMSDELANFYRDNKLGGVINHDTRSHIRSDLGRYLFAAAFTAAEKSPRLTDFPRSLQPKHANRTSGKFVDRFKVQAPNKPASTITSHISKDGHYFIHYDPEQCRSLTVREAARVQTFPDNYFFEGNRTQQYVQVGNAVPPFLAQKIAVAIKTLL